MRWSILVQPAGSLAVVQVALPVFSTKSIIKSLAAWVGRETVMEEPVPPGLLAADANTVGEATSF